jgi:hypothetical protein
MTWLPRKTSISIVAFLAIAAMPDFVPRLAMFHYAPRKLYDAGLNLYAASPDITQAAGHSVCRGCGFGAVHLHEILTR